MVECKPEKLKAVVDSTFRQLKIILSFKWPLLKALKNVRSWGRSQVVMASMDWATHGAAMIRTKCKRFCKKEQNKCHQNLSCSDCFLKFENMKMESASNREKARHGEYSAQT